MARKIKMDDQEALLRMLNGETITDQPSDSDNTDSVQQLEETNIFPEMIKNYKEKEAPNAFNYRSQVNDIDNSMTFPALSEQMQEKTAADKYRQSGLDLSDKTLSMLARRAGSQIDLPEKRESKFDAQAYQKSLKEQLDSLAKEPSDVSDNQKIMNALIPAALTVAFGPSSAPAGLYALELGQKDIEGARNRIKEERLNKIRSIGSQIKGVGALAKSESEAAKNDFEQQKYANEQKDRRIKDFMDYMKYKTDKGIAISKEESDAYAQIQKMQNQNAMSAAKNISDLEEKQTGREFSSEEKSLDRKAQEKRARIAAAAAEKRMMEKPPTEGMTNFANAYASTQKAEQAFDRMSKDIGYVPSMSEKFFDFQKSLFESPQDKYVTEFLKMVPDANTRRQIQAELDFLAPVLRKDSGAAISVGEYLSYANRYFPRRGDDSSTIAEKNASRAQTMENYRVGAGRAPIPTVIQPEIKKMDRKEMLQKLKKLEGK